MTKPDYILILDAHPVEDGRIQKHIRFLQTRGYNVYHLHFITYASDPNIEATEYSLFGERSWHIDLNWTNRRKGLRLLNYLTLFSPTLIRKTADIIRSMGISSSKKGIIHVHDPILLSLAAKIQKNILTPARIVYDRHEVYEDMKPFAGYGGYRLFEQIAGNSVSGVVVVSERHKKSVSLLFPHALVSTVPNFPMQAFVEESDILEKINSFSESTPIICIYIGSLRRDLDRDVDLLFNLADEVLREIPNSRFVIGGSSMDDIVLNQIGSLIKKFPTRFTYLGLVPYNQLIKETVTAHIGFYFIKPDANYWVPCSPNKIFEYLSCGVIPIIRADCDYQDEIQDCGLFFSQNTSQKQIITELITLMKDPAEMLSLMKRNLSIGTQFTFDTAAGNYLLLYEKLI